MNKKSFSIDVLDKVIMASLLCLLCLTLIVQVIFRYVFNHPITWSEEIARYLFVWITMLGFSYNARTDNDISMVLVFQKFSDGTKKAIRLIRDFVGLVLFGFLTIHAIDYFLGQIPSKSPTLLFSMGFLGISVPIGTLLASVQFCLHFYDDIRMLIKKEEVKP